MTVKELCDALRPEVNGDLPVVVRARWLGEAPAHNEFDPHLVAEGLEPDTAEPRMVIVATQDGR